MAWLRLARVFQKVDTHSARLLRRYNLSVAQFDVIAQIGAAEGISQQELAGTLLVTKGNVSQLLKRLERQGLIRRTQEGRSNYLYLTPVGWALYGQVVPAQEAMIARLFAALTPTEQETFRALLRKLDHSLD